MLTLRANGQTVAEGLDQALDGIDSAALLITDVPGDLAYVLPDRSRTADHGAFYSAPRLRPLAQIQRAGFIWGQRDGRGFSHCHGLWDGTMGHLLAERCRLTRDCQARVLVITGARFESVPDVETGFHLFTPVATAETVDPDTALVRLAPHVDLCEGVAEAADSLGWASARVAGLGSLNAPGFQDGKRLDSHATEFLIRQGELRAGSARIELDIVGIGGVMAAGVVLPGAAPVCVTAELILRRQ